MPEQRGDLAITGLVMTEMEGIETILKIPPGVPRNPASVPSTEKCQLLEGESRDLRPLAAISTRAEKGTGTGGGTLGRICDSKIGKFSGDLTRGSSSPSFAPHPLRLATSCCPGTGSRRNPRNPRLTLSMTKHRHVVG
jgi:hypothetical protein